MLLCGIDWADDHHDVRLIDERGRELARGRVAHSMAGVSDLLGLLAAHGGGPETTRVGMETEHGLLVATLRAAGYPVYPINPKAVDRYRDRHRLAGGKSDRGDALVLAHILRTDAHLHRPLPADSDRARALVVLARAHKDLIWNRQRELGQLSALLKQFFPAALAAFDDLTTNTAVGLLAAAPTPARATASIKELERAIGESFDQHPDAEIYLSFPGLGRVLSARVLGEFGDDPTRWTHPADRRGYAGTAPITRASGRSRLVVARWIRNTRLHDAVRQWAFTAIGRSPRARALYQRRIDAGDGHEAALRRVGSKLIGQLHHCLAHRQRYDETNA